MSRTTDVSEYYVAGRRVPALFNLAAWFVDSWKEAGSGPGFTIPAENPKKRIDYIWLSRNGPITPVKMWVPETRASDHLPVVAELEFRH